MLDLGTNIGVPFPSQQELIYVSAIPPCWSCTTPTIDASVSVVPHQSRNNSEQLSVPAFREWLDMWDPTRAMVMSQDELDCSRTQNLHTRGWKAELVPLVVCATW